MTHFLHVLGDALAREFEVGHRLVDLLAADHLRDEIELLRRDAQILATALASLSARPRSRFALPMVFAPARLRIARRSCRSPLWPWNVRVGENSPNLWPTMSSVTLHRDVLVAVVDAEREPDELRQDGRAPAPDPDDLVAAGTRAFSAFLRR